MLMALSQRKLLPSRFPRPLRVFLILFAAYTAITWISCGIHFLHGDPQAYSSPFIHKATDPWTDLRTYEWRFKDFHTLKFFEVSHKFWLAYFSYPAAASLIYWALYHAPHITAMYLLIAGVWIAVLLVALVLLLRRWRWSSAQATGFAVFIAATCFPLDFMIERGNIELIVWVVIFCGLGAFLYQRTYPAAVLLGVAAAFKIFPIIFCGLLFRRRTWRAFALALASAVALTLFALWFAGPTIKQAFIGFNGTVASYQRHYSMPARPADVGMDHSLFALAKVVGVHLHLDISTWLTRYYVIAGIGALALFFGRAIRLPLFNRVLFLTIMAVLLPPNSFDYTLVYLYAPWLMLVLAAISVHRSGAAPASERRLIAYFLCFVPLFAPFSLFVHHGNRFGGQVQTLALLVLLALCLAFPVEDSLWREPTNLIADPQSQGAITGAPESNLAGLSASAQRPTYRRPGTSHTRTSSGSRCRNEPVTS